MRRKPGGRNTFDIDDTPEFDPLPDIHSIGDMIYAASWTQPHISNNAELLHVRRGNIELYINGKKSSGAVGDFLIIPPGARHRDNFPDNTLLEVFLIQFSWPCANDYFATVNNQRIQHISTDIKFRAGRILDNLRFDNGAGRLDHLIANSRLHVLLLLIYRDIVSHQGSKEKNIFSRDRVDLLVENAKRYLEANYHRHISLEDVAGELKVSSFHLSRVFSRESGYSLIEYLNELRMRKALELLSEGRTIISEIAEQTGFSSRHYFTKVFKRRFGASPSKYNQADESLKYIPSKYNQADESLKYTHPGRRLRAKSKKKNLSGFNR
jgi:AraC-like DNA-binding protein